VIDEIKREKEEASNVEFVEDEALQEEIKRVLGFT
jgi:hypothetical protein